MSTTEELPDRETMAAAIAEAVNMNAGRQAPPPAITVGGRLLPEQEAAWLQDGYFIVKGLVDTSDEVNTAAIDLVRDIATTGEAFGNSYMKDGRFVVGEHNFDDGTPPEFPEDHASKLYNLHRHGVFNEIARHEGINHVLSGLIGDDVDCFNSQFIFKNPGAWGQPWHQDSLYFTFDREPQVGMWLATSEATVENGCLYISPGSHTEPLHVHVPDRRPAANLGYVEVIDHDFSDEIAVLMEPGDVLFFHSFLMHRSADNNSDGRRTALVYHYGEPGTKQTANESGTIDWMPTARGGVAV